MTQLSALTDYCDPSIAMDITYYAACFLVHQSQKMNSYKQLTLAIIIRITIAGKTQG